MTTKCGELTKANKDCNRNAMWEIRNNEYEGTSSFFACPVHLSQMLLSGEYSEGDTFIVKRVRFD